MTFWPAHKAMRSICGGPKCGGEKPHKGRRPTAVFRSPSRLLAASVNSPVMCSAPVPHYFLLFPSKLNLSGTKNHNSLYYKELAINKPDKPTSIWNILFILLLLK
jgi:hypothetical protein